MGGALTTTNFDTVHDDPDAVNNIRLSGPLPPGQVGAPYTGTIQLETRAIRECHLHRGGLPPGLALAWKESDKTVLVQGTPAAAGAFTFRVMVSGYATMP
ncbi:hypothetical protein Pelo_5871 [Pelomyxa schiedti]|nr:hypothetical protein Pelo_5871 [Pelomyxa schiedti]